MKMDNNNFPLKRNVQKPDLQVNAAGGKSKTLRKVSATATTTGGATSDESPTGFGANLRTEEIEEIALKDLDHSQTMGLLR